MIACRICGREFQFLPPHLKRAHGMTPAEYRREFSIPAGVALASEEYSAAQAAKMARMQADGRLTYDHLPAATEAARCAERTPRTEGDLRQQSERVKAVRPWASLQRPAGAKRADGRDADKAREYQREYRKRKALGL